jgi:hypothetical protein
MATNGPFGNPAANSGLYFLPSKVTSEGVNLPTAFVQAMTATSLQLRNLTFLLSKRFSVALLLS